MSSPTGGPFPCDRFTVDDSEQNTGRRVNLPMPTDCVANASDCDDIRVLNRLDGFHQHPRVSIPFDGKIDPATARGNIFLLELPESISDPPASASCDDAAEAVEDDSSIGRMIGINQVAWDVATLTLHARAASLNPTAAIYARRVTRSPRGTADSFSGRSGPLAARGSGIRTLRPSACSTRRVPRT